MTFRHIRIAGFAFLGILFVVPGIRGPGFSHQVEGIPGVELIMQEATPSEWAKKRLRNIQDTLRDFVHSRAGRPALPNGLVIVNNVHEKDPIVEATQGMDRNTPMTLASLTKPITATGILILVDQGKLRLDDPVSRYLPEFRMERHELGSAPITIRNLLQQTSGIPYAGRSPMVPSGVEGFFMPRQMYPAGMHHEYSNSNYELLGFIVERVTGMTFAAFMQENLFGPLKMKNSRAAGVMSGASGITSTAEDLSHFAKMLLSWGRYEGMEVLSPELIREMFLPPPHIPVSENMSYYAMGWKVNVAHGRVVEAYHPGVWFNMLTDLRIYPTRKMFFVTMSNPPFYRSDAATEFMGMTVGHGRRAVAYMGPSEDLEARPTQPDAGILNLYSGQYANSDGAVLRIAVQGKNIVRKMYQDERVLAPISQYEFTGDGNAMPHEFVWKNGQVAGLNTPGGYYERRFPR